MYIIVAGDPLSGFEFFGVFPSEELALNWGERCMEDREWWVAEVSTALAN